MADHDPRNPQETVARAPTEPRHPLPSLDGPATLTGSNPAAPVPHADVFSPGDLLGGVYEIVRVLGSGGMGQVYQAHDQLLNRLVAIKVSWPEAPADILLQEARALAAFHHEGLVGVHALGRHEGMDFLVMEHLSGIPLAKHLDHRRGEGFTIDETVEILLGLCEALAVLHGAGLAHRDLKPDNVMLAPRGRVVLLDFGIVLMERHVSDVRMIEGSPHYIAPESVTATMRSGEAHLVDLYALGVIAFELLTGRPPFEGDVALDLFMKHLRTPPAPVLSLRPDAPPALATLISELLAKEPSDRPSSIEVVTAALRALRPEAPRASDRGLPDEPVVDPISVLIVDDNSDVRRLIERLVHVAVPTAVIRTAHNGEEALKRFREEPPAALFLDLQMPVMNGVEVCMYLRGTSLAARTTICVISDGAVPTTTKGCSNSSAWPTSSPRSPTARTRSPPESATFSAASRPRATPRRARRPARPPAPTAPASAPAAPERSGCRLVDNLSKQ